MLPFFLQIELLIVIVKKHMLSPITSLGNVMWRIPGKTCLATLGMTINDNTT